jgi:NADPH:quinone reductase-like Zn-dependent oxidoreductase
MGIANVNQEDLIFVRDLLEAGAVTPVIDRSCPLHEAVAALRYVTREHAAGKVVLTVGPDQASESVSAGEPS